MSSASFLGLTAIGWSDMLKSTWNKITAIFILTTLILAIIYLIYRLFYSLKAFLLRRKQTATVPRAVNKYLASSKRNAGSPLVAIVREEPKSFGVFLGSFQNPPTKAQANILSQWDIIVVDPMMSGITDALNASTHRSRQVLGRLDICSLTQREKCDTEEQIVDSIQVLDEKLSTYFSHPSEPHSPFTAILLANFGSHFSPPVVNELIRHINTFGIPVWLELSQTDCLSGSLGRQVKMKHVAGLVYRNGTIRTDGEQQNFHQMEPMRATQRAVAAQRVAHGPPMMLWETIDDGLEHQYAVVQRSYNWCRFNSALVWIGSSSAMFDADVARARTVQDKPLGALMWMKNDKNMKAHNTWRANDKLVRPIPQHDVLYDALNSFIPNLASKLQFRPSSHIEQRLPKEYQVSKPVQYSEALKHARSNPLSRSSYGRDYTGLGCFQLGVEVNGEQFQELLHAQQHLKELKLLEQLDAEELGAMKEKIQVLRDTKEGQTLPSAVSNAVQDLLLMLDDRIRNPEADFNVFVGLHSGFQCSSEVQFWGLYDAEVGFGGVDLYISKFTNDRASAVLHTYLSSRRLSRAECFIAEFAMAALNEELCQRWQLPQRIIKDIERMSPTETILLNQRLAVDRTEDSFFIARIRAACQYQLIDRPSLKQLRDMNSKDFLSGKISSEDLVFSRLNWYRECGWEHMHPTQALGIFEDVSVQLHRALIEGDSESYERLGAIMQSIMQEGSIDAGADLFALAVFCAFRSLALDEIYLEVLDRNAFPNHSSDQAGVFAENFAVGSRCDSFFDFTPRVLGSILSNRYRKYYMIHQPPDREDGYTELPTSYAAMQADSDTEFGNEEASGFYKVTFLGIFAVPALIDIGLLTTIGRGLYLTTFMTSNQKTFATTALMIALLVCGSIGSWISSGGCYYIYASAFPAMNMFVMTRFVAGVAVILFGSLASFVVITLLFSPADAAIFVFYFAMLSTYLLVLSALSIYQIPGSSFRSGRWTIMMCIPILFISPILTIFIQNDVAVYLSVLTVFLTSLLCGARKVMTGWATWFLNIPVVTDAEVLEWYAKKHDMNASAEELKELSATGHARKELQSAVVKEATRRFWNSKTKDELIARLAAGYESTKFLMIWYCRHRRTAMPLPYSPTWNLTLKAGLENITNMQKGLKLHNAFLHWRHTGSDIWSGILYFVVALADKWAALLTGGGLVGLSAASSEVYRLAVGFGLCYYLIGAVSLDAVSQPLWTAANEKTKQRITSLESLRQATIIDSSARRRLYWTNLCKFFFLHLWGAAITAVAMWTFDNSLDATIMYFVYVGAYSGLLFYQYNKIFCGNDAAKSLAVAAIIAIPVGIALRVKLPYWAYSGVVALGLGTWIAGIYSLYITGIGLPATLSKPSSKTATDGKEDPGTKQACYACITLEPYPDLSQATLERSFEAVQNLPEEQRFRLKPSEHPGARVLELIMACSRAQRSELLHEAFPHAEQILESTIELWSSGSTVVELVGAHYLPNSEPQLRSISRKIDSEVHIIVAMGSKDGNNHFTADIHRNSRIAAEALVSATCEQHLGISHDHSVLAELLVTDDVNGTETPIPEGIKLQLDTSSKDRALVIANGNKVALRHLLLGVDPETDWDDLPLHIRSFLLKHSSGKSQFLSVEEEDWITSRACAAHAFNCVDEIARYHLAAVHASNIVSYARLTGPARITFGSDTNSLNLSEAAVPTESDLLMDTSATRSVKRVYTRAQQVFKACVKFFILALVADPEYQRELAYMTQPLPSFIRYAVTYFLNSIWIYVKFLQGIILPVVIFSGRDNVKQLRSNMKGVKTVLKKDKVTIENLKGLTTCFWSRNEDGTIKLRQYNGQHDKEPEDLDALIAINTYGDKFLLSQREEYKGEKLLNMFTYEYPAGKKSSRLPLQRHCLQGKLSGEIVQYDWRGYITTGSTFRGPNAAKFTFWYRKNAKFDDELLRGEYVLPHITIRIMWSMPPRSHVERLDDWVPFPKVTEATFIEGSDVYHATWAYEHKFHPSISTTLNGDAVDTPKMISEDWFHVLTKPQKLGFLSDNPLFDFSSIATNPVSRFLRLNEKRYPISTANARTQLWKLWKNTRELDAVTARYLDEDLMRSDSSLRTYWRSRDLGLLGRATNYLDSQADTIMARTDVDAEISAWVHVALQISDLYSFGSGGDTTINTRTHSGHIQDSDDELHVMAMDTSTWPYEPGGVSACRRDMVNDLKTTKWHIVAEMAHDYGVPRFQIERNVKSLTILPLWGLDFLNPTHGMLRNCLDSEVVEKSYDTRTADIRKNFLPILKSLVQCARTTKLTRSHLEEATKALVDLNTYFQSSRSWNDVWSSEVVKTTWRELWLVEDLPNSLSVSEWWDFEKPTMQQLDQALNLWCRYLFIFSIPVPEKIPDVFQASHHFTGATYGILCKVKRNVSLHVWDHCISFREFTTFMSSAVSFDMPFVNSSLMSLGHLACVLLEHHADVVLPCCDYYNPGWEVELGTAEGVLEHRRTFARKIDPVVNGICNMEKFEPIKTIKTETPTVVMLSHIQFVKDIKNAILATDLIVNQWGFKDYRLHIYGDMERAAGHSTECQELIASKGLGEHCVLKGLGNASLVLQDAWVFLNSSISEGLPLAMGEAALTGVPVVCTDVGASYCVVTDRATGDQFSEVVPPNDCESLARAQINILALLGKWVKHAEDAPGVEAPILSYPNPTPAEVEAISQRMYDKREHRRKLGMLGRENVLGNFSADRYLREHEQMLWIGKHRSPNYRASLRAHRIAMSSRASNTSSIVQSMNNSGFNVGSSSSVTEKKTFGISLTGLPQPPARPRLTPDRWSSAPSSRASSLWKIQRENVLW